MNLGQLPTDITCHSCRWYVEDRCRRHSPGHSGWPFTGEDDFCGDWDQRWERVDGKWQPVV
jgi:hypothetical protein